MSPFAHGLVAFIHLFGVVLSLGGVFARSRALARIPDPDAEARALTADNVWGISALIMIPTGLYRLLGVGKGVGFYMANPFFLVKMAGFVGVLLLEVWPMVVLVRHRLAARRGAATLDPALAHRFARISMVQAVLLLIILFCAPMMARGVGQMG